MAKKKALVPSAPPVSDPNVKPLAAALTPLELHAIAKVGGQAAKLRDRLSVGAAQRVDVTVRVHGAISVGEDQPGGTGEQAAPAEIVLGLLLPLLKPMARQSAIDSLRAHFSLWLQGGEPPKLSEQHEAIADEFRRGLTRQVHTSGRRGNVSGAIGCELVDRKDFAD